MKTKKILKTGLHYLKTDLILWSFDKFERNKTNFYKPLHGHCEKLQIASWISHALSHIFIYQSYIKFS